MSTTQSPPETPQRKLNLENGVDTSKALQSHQSLTTGENASVLPPKFKELRDNESQRVQVASSLSAKVPLLTADEEEVVPTVNEEQDVVGRADLRPFHWRDFQLRYIDALAKANAEEDQLTDLFEAYSEVSVAQLNIYDHETNLAYHF